ncbi:MAG: hypothetical protein ACYTKD_02290 [Planctomycetota bacterium]
MDGMPPSGHQPGGPDAPSADVRFLFDCLLNEDEARAIAIHDRLLRYRPNTDLAECLNERDLEDCLFLLAEACYGAARRGEALRHYLAVLELQDAGCPAPLLEHLEERVRELRRGGRA